MNIKAIKRFDVVFLVGPKDLKTIDLVVCYAKRNIIGYRNIYLLSCDKNLYVNGCITIDEKDASFTKEDIKGFFKTEVFRGLSGWYLQQLLKLYAGFFIKDILDDYLVIDADVYFLKKVSFFSESGKTLFATGTEYHACYFEHMKKLHPTLTRFDPRYSGICHHMMFNKQKLQILISLVESYHSNQVFWKILLQCVNEFHNHEAVGSGLSEYEIFFNFMMIYYPESCEIRQLNWRNILYKPTNRMVLYKYRKNDFVSQCVRGGNLNAFFMCLKNKLSKKIKKIFLK